MLIECSECGQKVSDKSEQCIHCGYPLNNLKEINFNTVNKSGIYKITLMSCDYNVRIPLVRIVNMVLKTALLDEDNPIRDAKNFFENTPRLINKGLSYEKCIELQKIYDSYDVKTIIEEDTESKEQNTTLDDVNLPSLIYYDYKNRKNDVLACPKCKSTHVGLLNRGHSIIWGLLGSGKPQNVCQICGYTWYPK